MKLTDQTIRIIVFAGTLFVTWILMRVNRMIFKKIYRSYKMLYLRFFERLITAAVFLGGVFVALSSFGGFQTVWKTLLGGTAFASAILIFAAQDSIKDILAGLMISIYKPFEIGNRIELEDGTAGIVKDISMRHVVLQLQDTQTLIVPNSRLNAMNIRNYSYMESYRSAMFRFSVAYDTDVEKAMEVIRQAVVDSPYSRPEKETDHGKDYAPVYFMAFEESSLRLTTTVYYEPSSPSETVISDVNLRVNRALKENGIEIPYPYVNVVQREEESAR